MYTVVVNRGKTKVLQRIKVFDWFIFLLKAVFYLLYARRKKSFPNVLKKFEFLISVRVNFVSTNLCFLIFWLAPCENESKSIINDAS